MANFELDVEPRVGGGSSVAKRLRAGGLLPSVVYARGQESMSCSVGLKQFVQLAQKAKSSTVFTLKSSASNLNGRLAIVKDIQKAGLSGKVLHVDFQALKENEAITVQVPLRIFGEPVGVKLDGGILSVVAYEISLSCLPKDIPQELDLDVSDVKLGGSVHAKDLKLPAGVKLAGDEDETIASVVAVRQTVEAAATEADAAAAAAAPAAGAAAPAAGATAAPAAAGAKPAAGAAAKPAAKK